MFHYYRIDNSVFDLENYMNFFNCYSKKESGGRVSLDPTSPNIILLQTGRISLKEKSEFLWEKLQALV
jgi:hypothetical protein